MTTAAPIDVDINEAIALIDFENIRLSWEKSYHRLFRYTDLCWLCDLVEHQFATPISRIMVFMSDPNECIGSFEPEQLAEMQRVLSLLQEDQARPSSNLQSDSLLKAGVSHSTKKSSKRRKVERPITQVVEDEIIISDDSDVASDKTDNCQTQSSTASHHSISDPDPKAEERKLKQYESSHSNSEYDNNASTVSIESEVEEGMIAPSQANLSYSRDSKRKHSHASPNISIDEDCQTRQTCSDNESNASSTVEKKHSCSACPSDDEEPFVRLGQNVCLKADIFVRVFGYKQSGRRRIQRACDVAIGNELTKVCFLPRFNKIYLFSADSDFEETVRSCAGAEDMGGGIIKYAKQIRMFGFSHAFQMRTALLIRSEYQREARLFRKRANVNPQIHFLDYEFPLIRKIIQKRPLLANSSFRNNNINYAHQLRKVQPLCPETDSLTPTIAAAHQKPAEPPTYESPSNPPPPLPLSETSAMITTKVISDGSSSFTENKYTYLNQAKSIPPWRRNIKRLRESGEHDNSSCQIRSHIATAASSINLSPNSLEAMQNSIMPPSDLLISQPAMTFEGNFVPHQSSDAISLPSRKIPPWAQNSSMKKSAPRQLKRPNPNFSHVCESKSSYYDDSMSCNRVSHDHVQPYLSSKCSNQIQSTLSSNSNMPIPLSKNSTFINSQPTVNYSNTRIPSCHLTYVNPSEPPHDKVPVLENGSPFMSCMQLLPPPEFSSTRNLNTNSSSSSRLVMSQALY